MHLYCEQIRAGRNLVHMKQQDLASAANVSHSTLKRIENMRGPVSANYETIAAIQTVLEQAGVEFTNGDRPGVRMSARVAPKQ